MTNSAFRITALHARPLWVRLPGMRMEYKGLLFNLVNTLKSQTLKSVIIFKKIDEDVMSHYNHSFFAPR